MAIMIYKEKIKDDLISIGFQCEYDDKCQLELKDGTDSYFDSGDYRIRIQNSIKKLSSEILSQYLNKYFGCYYIAVAHYFLDEIPNIYFIKFESTISESIYFAEELRLK